MRPNTGNATSGPMAMKGALHGNKAVCDRVHSQYCRRQRQERRPECARMCVEDASCVSTVYITSIIFIATASEGRNLVSNSN